MSYEEIALHMFQTARTLTELALLMFVLAWAVGRRLRSQLADGPERRWCHRCGEAFFVNRGGEQVK